ncbi:ATP synthase subunit b, mitochondrial-like [Octopus vulgaris]|uniref:ATP synthase subunit b, mitochondrial-like n=2 Tax=Octopus TaxID=6643 RepID=A0AA36BL23_OCTVU|nr:ATP synthase subunit b, mitochondrial isoform X1 [Octopus sinensis]CAI9736134.1 ATP synthase subunit b, mitochondrial-like [Octopus vulgaris]
MLAVRTLRSGHFGCVLKQLNGKHISVPARLSSSVVEQVKNWETANERYFGPERDVKNFPHPAMLDQPKAVKFGFVPASWFDFLYPKTGFTGPYVLGAGLLATVMSKEIWVIDHGFADVIGFTGAFLFLVYKVGPGMAKFLEGKQQRIYEETYTKPIAKAKETFVDEIKECNDAIWSLEGQKYLFEAKKENVGLQLESAYRKRLNKVYTDVKSRLDYHVAVENTKRRFEQEHMVNWIVSSVVKSITPQQEKESIKKCIAELKTLAAA